MNYEDNEMNPYARPQYDNTGYTPIYQEPPRKKKKGFFKKALAYVGCAILLGIVAGAACYGVTYAGYTIFPAAGNASEQSGNNSNTATGNSQAIDTSGVRKEITATVMDVSDIVDMVITSVVAINGTYTSVQNNGFWGSQTYQSNVSGSGIIIGTNETELLVVTNDHVVSDVDNLAITFYDGSEASAIVKGSRSSSDLAVIAVKLADIPSDAIYSFATLGDSTETKVGDAAIAVGNSMGYGISVTTGCVSALNKTVTVDSTEYTDLIQTDAAINPGNSGGALFNAYGEVIGINSVKMSQTNVEGMGYAISISSVRDIIETLSLEETKEKLDDEERGYLGITGISITSDISASYGYPEGVLVRSVTENSGADIAGIIKNDIIVSVDGEEIYSFDKLKGLMSYYAVGEVVEVEYYRMNNRGDYEIHSVSVTLTAKPE